MYNMIRNLESVNQRRYKMFLSSQLLPYQQTSVNQQNNIMKQTGIQTRGKPLMSTNKRTMSMVGITGYKSSGGGCGCGS